MTRVFRVVFSSYVVLVVVLSLVPRGPDLPEGGDKLAHFGAYMLMAILGMAWPTRFRSAVGMFLFVVAVGAALEGFQAMIPARTASGWDLVFNLVGATAGTLVWLGAVKVQQRWPTRVES